MTREEALELLEKKLKKRNLIKHSLAVEAVMGELARYFKLSEEDVERWKMAGLLHDLDYQKTLKKPQKHGLLSYEWLKDSGLDEEILDAIKSHPGHSERKTLMAKALYATDPLTGLIVAAALIHPSKKLEPLTPEFIKKRFKEKRFAANASREQIASCSEFGLDLMQFFEIALKAMKKIHQELGL